MNICLSFIAFEVGGALKWTKIKKHRKEIQNITLLGSLLSFVIVASGVFLFSIVFPDLIPFKMQMILLLTLTLGVLARACP